MEEMDRKEELRRLVGRSGSWFHEALVFHGHVLPTFQVSSAFQVPSL